jgi:RNA polymerase sigma-70 factor (ECF subfamily)
MIGIARIIADYGAGLARVAASYEADKALQEDLQQEILIAIHRALPTLEKAESLAPFVFRIAHNRCVTHVMKRAGERRRAVPDEPAIEAATPEQMLIADERARRLTAAVRRLPLRYRQVMTLLLEDLSYAEIAEALEISLSNVGVRVNRAKAQLKVMLDEQ